MMKILCYTRMPKEDMIYANRLAYSIHLAYDTEDGRFVPFHHNEGLVYAKATHKADGTIVAKSLKKPWLFLTEDGQFGLAAIRTEAEGGEDIESEGCILLWKSKDLVHFEEIGLIRLQAEGMIQEVRCQYDAKNKGYCICWQSKDGKWMEGVTTLFTEGECINRALEKPKQVPRKDHILLRQIKMQEPSIHTEILPKELTAHIEGIQIGNYIEVNEQVGEYLCHKLLVPVCEKMELTQEVDEMSIKNLKAIKAAATYSDGVKVERKIDWYTKSVDDKSNEALIEGVVHQEHFEFPFTENRADPCCMYWRGKYYFIATNDADNNHTLYIRCADTLQDIVTAKETLILDSKTYKGIGGLLWAPEFHEIGGKMYIFHAATEGEFFREESRVMALRENGDPMCTKDWSEPHLVVKKDGSPLCEAGKVISLDMTTFYYQGQVYAIWSQRQFLPVDQGAWLYIAQLDENEPWKLVSDPVCLAKPEYGWENNHTFVVEGPYALEYNGQLMVTYSGAAVDATYAVGLLKPKMGSDIMDPMNWQKSNYPLMSSRSCEGEYGTGHNSYLQDENGIVWNFYHGRKGVDGPRSSGARRVHFDVDGEPMLDVLEELDLPEKLRSFSIKYKSI